MGQPPAIVVFSHLRWNWVYQRPQHLVSRMARRQRVFFVEEPVFEPKRTTGAWRFSEPEPNVTVCTPRLPQGDPGLASPRDSRISRLVIGLLQAHSITDFVAWFYNPMAVPIAASIRPRLIV